MLRVEYRIVIAHTSHKRARQCVFFRGFRAIRRWTACFFFCFLLQTIHLVNLCVCCGAFYWILRFD